MAPAADKDEQAARRAQRERSRAQRKERLAKKKAGEEDSDLDVEEDDKKNPTPLDDEDIALLKAYGAGTYNRTLKQVEKDIQDAAQRVNEV
jgi:hypothetical protein